MSRRFHEPASDAGARPASKIARIEHRAVDWLARHRITLLRISLGLVYVWFGALKLFPGVSPAEDLAAHTLSLLTCHLVPPSITLPSLAIWECLIGLGLLTHRFMRVTLVLLLLQMVGTVIPLFFFPWETFSLPPFVPTLEGQYIIKNLVLISAALAIGGDIERRVVEEG
jgi:uncharacterized membrane protein YkgB